MTDAKKKNLIILKTDGGGEKRAKLISDEGAGNSRRLGSRLRFLRSEKTARWAGMARRRGCKNVSTGAWPADLMIAGAAETSKRKRDGPIENYKYLEKPLARFIAEQARPLPKN